MINPLPPEHRGHSAGIPPHESVVHFGASEVMRGQQHKERAQEENNITARLDDVSILGGSEATASGDASQQPDNHAAQHHAHAESGADTAQFEGAMGRGGAEFPRADFERGARSTRQMMGPHEAHAPDGEAAGGISARASAEMFAASVHSGMVSHEAIRPGHEDAESQRETDAEEVDSSQESTGSRAERNAAKSSRRSSMQSNLGSSGDGGGEGEQPGTRSQHHQSGGGSYQGGRQGGSGDSEAPRSPTPVTAAPQMAEAAAIVDISAVPPALPTPEPASERRSAVDELASLPAARTEPVAAEPASTTPIAAPLVSSMREVTGKADDTVHVSAILSPGLEFVHADEYLFFDDARYAPPVEEAS